MKKIKEILIFCILVIVIGIAMATVVIKIEQKSNEDNADKENINSESTSNITPTEDALRFKKEYEDVNGTIREKDGMLFNNVDIPEQNPIQYINIDEFVDILNNKSGIVFLSSPTCPYCRASISSLLKAAKELKMTTIYYYDISKDENETDSENEIQELKRYGIITENEEGKNAWKIPQLLNIKDKKIVSSANGAMYELENGQTKYDKLTQIQENDIYNIYKKVFGTLIGTVVILGTELIVVAVLNITSKELIESSMVNEPSAVVLTIIVKMMTFVVFEIIKQFSSKESDVMDGRTFLLYMVTPLSCFR